MTADKQSQGKREAADASPFSRDSGRRNAPAGSGSRSRPPFRASGSSAGTKTGLDSRRGTGARQGRGDGPKPGAPSQRREGAPGARVNSRTARTTGDGYSSRVGSGRSPASGRWDDRGSSRRSSQPGNSGDARFGSRQGRPETASDRRGGAGASRARNDNRTAPVHGGERDVDRRGGYSRAADARPRSYGRPQRAPAFGPPTGHSSARTQRSAPSSGARGSGGRPWASTGSPRSREPGPQWGRSRPSSGGGARPSGVPERSFDGDSRGTGGRSAPRSYGRQVGAYQSRDAGSWPRESYSRRAGDGRTADRAPYRGRTSDGRTADRAPYRGRTSDGRTADRAPYTSGRAGDGRTADRAPYQEAGPATVAPPTELRSPRECPGEIRSEEQRDPGAGRVSIEAPARAAPPEVVLLPTVTTGGMAAIPISDAPAAETRPSAPLNGVAHAKYQTETCRPDGAA